MWKSLWEKTIICLAYYSIFDFNSLLELTIFNIYLDWGTNLINMQVSTCCRQKPDWCSNLWNMKEPNCLGNNLIEAPTYEICKHQFSLGSNLIDATTYEICKHLCVVRKNIIEASTSEYHNVPPFHNIFPLDPHLSSLIQQKILIFYSVNNQY